MASDVQHDPTHFIRRGIYPQVHKSRYKVLKRIYLSRGMWWYITDPRASDVIFCRSGFHLHVNNRIT